MPYFMITEKYHEEIGRNIITARKNRNKYIFCTKKQRESEELVYDFVETGNRGDGSSDSD